jgi:hypothetical protein
VKEYLKANNSTFDKAEKQLALEARFSDLRNQLSEAQTLEEIESIEKEIQNPNLADDCARVGYRQQYDELKKDVAKHLRPELSTSSESEERFRIETQLKDLWSQLSKAKTYGETTTILKKIQNPDLADKCSRTGCSKEYAELKDAAWKKHSDLDL